MEKYYLSVWSMNSIISNNCTQFQGKKLRQCVMNYGFIHFSIPYYTQANRQVEAVNKTPISILKMKLYMAKGLCTDELLQILWSYQTTMKTTIE